MGGAASSERFAGGRGRGGGRGGRGRERGGLGDVNTAVRGGWVHQMAGVYFFFLFLGGVRGGGRGGGGGSVCVRVCVRVRACMHAFFSAVACVYAHVGGLGVV
jgi:hypothetical protein